MCCRYREWFEEADPSSYPPSVIAYRTLYILGLLQNEIQKDPLSQVIATALIILQSVSTSTLIRVKSKSGIVFTIVLGLISMDTIIALIFILGVMAQVYTQSKDSLRNCKRALTYNFRIKPKWTQRFLISCAPIKVRFGSINFIDRMTPLNCVNFANNLTVQLLLVSENTLGK